MLSFLGGKGCGHVGDVADEVGRGVGGQGGVEPAAGVTDEEIAGLQRRDDRVAAVGQRGLLVDACAMTRKVHGDALVSQPFQLVDRPFPAPRGVKTAVHEDKTHQRPETMTPLQSAAACRSLAAS